MWLFLLSCFVSFVKYFKSKLHLYAEKSKGMDIQVIQDSRETANLGGWRPDVAP